MLHSKDQLSYMLGSASTVIDFGYILALNKPNKKVDIILQLDFGGTRTPLDVDLPICCNNMIVTRLLLLISGSAYLAVNEQYRKKHN
jgi:hypothetical protein